MNNEGTKGTKMNNKSKSDGGMASLLKWLARRFGYVLLPESEIRRMEQDASECYLAFACKGELSTRETGYFNGMADYASKTAMRLRKAASAAPLTTDH